MVSIGIVLTLSIVENFLSRHFHVFVWNHTVVPHTSAQVRRGCLSDVSRCLHALSPEYPGAFTVSPITLQATHFTSQHIVADAIHVWQGFISAENPDQFFSNVSKNTFKNSVNDLVTLVGDAILVSSAHCSSFNEKSTGPR